MTTIRGHTITGNFIVDAEPNEGLDQSPHFRVSDTVGPYIDYLFITFDRFDRTDRGDCKETDIGLALRDSGCDMQDREDEIFFKKIQPITCQGLYPELDDLLSAMINDEVNDVLFYPFKTRKYGSAYKIRDNCVICLNGHVKNIKVYYHCLENNECAKESFVRQERSFKKTHLDNIITSCNHVREFMSEQIEMLPLTGKANFGCRSSDEVFRCGPFVSDMTIRVNWTEHSLYEKFIKDITLQVGGIELAELPFEFLELYYRYVCGFSLQNCRHNKTSFYPINLKKIFGISSIALWRLDYHQVRIATEFNYKNVLERNEELPNSEVRDYSIYHNYQYTSDNDESTTHKSDDVVFERHKRSVSAIRSIRQLDERNYRVEDNKIIISITPSCNDAEHVEWILVFADSAIEPECQINGTVNSEERVELEIEPEFIKAMHQPEQGRYLVMDNCDIDGEIVLTGTSLIKKIENVSVFVSTKKYVTYYNGMMGPGR
jgi:hypothetical protein